MKNINNGDLVLALRESKWWILGVSLFMIASVYFLTITHKDNTRERIVGVMGSLNHNTLSRSVQKRFFDKKITKNVYEGEIIHSGSGHTLQLELSGETKIELQENTLIEVSLTQRKITLHLGKIRFLKKQIPLDIYNTNGEKAKESEGGFILATTKPPRLVNKKRQKKSPVEINVITTLPLNEYNIAGSEDVNDYAEIVIENPSVDLIIESESLFDQIHQKKRAIFRLKKENGLNSYSIKSKGQILYVGEYQVNRFPKNRLFNEVLYYEKGTNLRFSEKVEISSGNRNITLDELNIKMSNEQFEAIDLDIKRNDYNADNIEKLTIKRKKDPIELKSRYEAPYLPYTIKTKKNIDNKITINDLKYINEKNILSFKIERYGQVCISGSVVGNVSNEYREKFKKCTEIIPLNTPERIIQLINIDDDFRYLGLDLKSTFNCSQVFYGIIDGRKLKTNQMQLLTNRKIKYRSSDIPKQILISCDGNYTLIRPQHPILPFDERAQ